MATLGNAAAWSAEPQRGALYRVRHQGHTAWLFGTIHVGQSAFYPLEATVRRALAASSTLALELDPRDQSAMQQAVARHALYPAGETIAQHIPAASLAQLKTALAAAGLPFDSVARMRPWMVANLLMALELDRNGYKMDQAVDLHLLALAGGKTLLQLESADAQMALFDSMPAAQQQAYLDEGLAAMADGTSLQKTRTLIDAWGRADRVALDRLLAELQSERTVSSTFLRQVLLERRNPPMADQVEGLLKKEKTSFVAVGLLHLLGETGLPRLLGQRGYRVERVY